MKLGVMFSMTRSVFLRVWLVEGITWLVLPRTGSWSAGFHSQPEPEAELQMLLPFRTTKAPLYEYRVSLHGARTCRVSWACVWQHGQQTLARPKSSEPQHSAKLLVRRLGPWLWAFTSSNNSTPRHPASFRFLCLQGVHKKARTQQTVPHIVNHRGLGHSPVTASNRWVHAIWPGASGWLTSGARSELCCTA